MKLYLLYPLVTMALMGCTDRVDTEKFQDLQRKFEEVVSSTTDQVMDLSPSKDDLSSLTTEEFKKLSSFEYKVVELPKEVSSLELEAKLGVLGADRWDCFQVDPTDKSYRIFCRRRPETYLRYIPRMFP